MMCMCVRPNVAKQHIWPATPPKMAWHEDHRRKSTGEQFECVATLVMASRKSHSFTGYWQRAA